MTTVRSRKPTSAPKTKTGKFQTWLRGLWPSRKNDTKQIFWLKILRLVGLLAGVGLIIAIIVFLSFFFYFNATLPSPTNVVRQTGFSTKIYDRNGELLYDVYGDQRRDPVEFNQISERMKQATIAIEDKDFYNHSGFDFLTIMRIPYYYLTNGRVVGGSTLTQQLIKNMLLTNERSITRKFKEIILSMQLESYYDKDEILHLYLNEAPYGGNIYGVGTAARVYFNKPASDLSIAESAVLAGLPQNPTSYSPFAGRTNDEGEFRWRARAHGVLRRMWEDGYINDQEYQAAQDELAQISFDQQVSSINAPHFVFFVKDILEEMYGAELAESGGLKVTTSLDLNLHRDVQTIVAEEVAGVANMKVSNGAALVMNPQTGEILSMVGSKDYFSKEIDGQFNVTVDALRQPGSSIKPLTYLGYLQLGNTPETIMADVPTSFSENDLMKPYEPRNYDGTFRGPVTVRQSLGNSLNIPAVKAVAEVGLENFLQLGYDAGLSTFEPTETNIKRFGMGLAVTLGGADVHMIDLASAYSAFGNQGRKTEPVAILKVEDKDGRVIYEYKQAETKQVFGEGETYLINDILSDNSARAAAFGSNSQLNASPNIAVKTGTTNDLLDNWTIGWSQEFLVTTWVGNNDNSPMSGLVSGITGAAPMWRRIVDRMLELGYQAVPFEAPDNIETVEVDAMSGYPKHDDFPTKSAQVVKGTLSQIADPVHVKLKLCRGQNKLATDAQIAAGDYEEKEFIILQEQDPVSRDGKNRYQEAIDAWIAGQDEKYRPPTEYCGDTSDVYIRFEGLENEKSYNEEKLTLKVFADSGEGIEKIKLFINGELKYERDGNRLEEEHQFGAGRWEIYAEAIGRDGQVQRTTTHKIGTGGRDWKEPEPDAGSAPPASPSGG